MNTPHRNYVKGLVSMILGLWLWTSAATFGYSHPAPDLNDGICGFLLFVCGVFWMAHPRAWVAWGMCLLGLWLQFAPLLFWYPDPAAYLNDTVIGVLVMITSVVMPDRHYPPERTDHVPLGWSYNPSAWIQRVPIVGLAVICWFISRYLAAFQLGYIDAIWDPVFGQGTYDVITSSVSKAWPVSDAGLGAFSYTIDALMGCQGDTKRWCSSPWAVILFGFLVIPIGIISIVLIILQPVAVGAWCFLCLVTALCMLVMLALTTDEVVACVQYLHQCHRAGRPFWHTFWYGGRPFNTPGKIRKHSYPFSALLWGLTFPFNVLGSILLGIWLLLSPTVFHSCHPFASSDYITGALVIAFSVIAIAEVTRTARLLNVLFGAWLFAAPWILEGATLGAHLNNHIVGLVLIGFAYSRGEIKDQYGTYTKMIG